MPEETGLESCRPRTRAFSKERQHQIALQRRLTPLDARLVEQAKTLLPTSYLLCGCGSRQTFMACAKFLHSREDLERHAKYPEGEPAKEHEWPMERTNG